MTISERLRQIIDYLHLTPNAFAGQIGVSQPRLMNYLQGRYPDYDALSRICKTFVMIDARWLLTGEGKMLHEDDQTNVPDISVDDLVKIIKTQAETLLEQQKFISELRSRVETLP